MNMVKMIIKKNQRIDMNKESDLIKTSKRINMNVVK